MTERTSGSAGDWFYLNRIRALWAVGGIIVSIVAAIITTTLYVNDLLARIKRLELQTTAINEALSFRNKIDRKDVTFNGKEEDPKCLPGYVMTGVRITYKDITNNPNGSIDCISLTPKAVP
jgi:hypothetical protein